MDTIGSYSQNRYPTHIGIIMDGNGRWAKQRSLPRSMGHFEGVKAAKRIVQAASELEIPYLTFYAFSTENWSRPSKEVDYLMNLFSTRLFSEINFYNSVGARILVRGNSSRFPLFSTECNHFDAGCDFTQPPYNRDSCNQLRWTRMRSSGQ